MRNDASKAARRDALANRERIVESALVVIARAGFDVPVAKIAAEAGVGVGTFYRGFADRAALMRELQLRAYDALIDILEAITDRGETGLPAIESYLLGAFAIAHRLVLPLHGVRPLVDADAVKRRERINMELERFISDARRAGAITTDANATDVIICSALVTQAFQFGSNWEAAAMRHIRIFVEGLSASGRLPKPAVTRLQVEEDFNTHTRLAPPSS